MIPYQLPAAMHVRLEVFNLLGQRVATLVDREQPAGSHTTSWDATDAAGQAVGAETFAHLIFLCVGDLDIPAQIPRRFRTL